MTTQLPVQPELLLDNQLCFKLYAASRAMIRGYKPMLDQLGLTYPQYLVLLVLWEWHATAPEQPTVKALGERLMLDSGTLTPLLKRLQQMGLIERKRSSRDEREVHLALSAEGVARQRLVLPLRDQLLCASGLNPGQMVELRNHLGNLLERFIADSGVAHHP